MMASTATYNRTCRKRYRVTSKFRFITSMVMMIGIMVGIFGLVSGLNVSRAITEPQYTQVEVCYGDTLWNIANTYKSDDTVILFGLPVAYPVLITFLCMFSINRLYSIFLSSRWVYLDYFLAGLGIFLLVYLIYFIATYIGFKRNIQEA